MTSCNGQAALSEEPEEESEEKELEVQKVSSGRSKKCSKKREDELKGRVEKR